MALLAHINLLLAAYGGVALATAARLKWDPSTYVALRELFPAEYRAAAAALCVLGAALLLLAHLAIAATGATSGTGTSRALLLTYACALSAVVASEVAFCWWAWRRAAAWLRSPAAEQLLDALRLQDHVRPLLAYLGRWHPLPHRVNQLVQEATEDAPCNGYLAAALVALLAALQVAAVVVAVLAALRGPRRDSRPALSHRTRTDSGGGGGVSSAWRAAAACVSFVVRIYYVEKRPPPPPPLPPAPPPPPPPLPLPG